MKEELLNQKSSIDLIEYRLTQFENNLTVNFDRLTGKIDTLITKINDNEIKQENLKTRVQKLEQESAEIKASQIKISNDMTNLKVTLAEKLSWSAGGGIVASVLIKAMEMLAK